MFNFKRNLGKQLKSQAEGLGACEDGVYGLERLNEQELINRYIHFVDFASKKGFPSNEFIKENFDKQLLEHNNIYVDAEFERRNARQVVVVQGKSRGILLYDGYTTADVYVRDNSEVIIDCSRMSKVFVHLYNQANVKIKQRGGAAVYVCIYSGEVKIESVGDVMVRKVK